MEISLCIFLESVDVRVNTSGYLRETFGDLFTGETTLDKLSSAPLNTVAVINGEIFQIREVKTSGYFSYGKALVPVKIGFLKNIVVEPPRDLSQSAVFDKEYVQILEHTAERSADEQLRLARAMREEIEKRVKCEMELDALRESSQAEIADLKMKLERTTKEFGARVSHLRDIIAGMKPSEVRVTAPNLPSQANYAAYEHTVELIKQFDMTKLKSRADRDAILAKKNKIEISHEVNEKDEPEVEQCQ